MAHLKALSIVTTLLALATLGILGQEAGAKTDKKSVQDGVYSAAQAERGEKVFEKACLECHPPEEFTGGYMAGWAGRTAHDLVEAIRDTMPENNPGSLKRQEFIDIVAYLFKINALPPGENKMDGKTVKQIQIEGPFGK